MKRTLLQKVQYLIQERNHERAMREVLQIIKPSAYANNRELMTKAAKLRDKYSTHAICDALQIDRGTFYNHIFTTGYEAGYYSYTWSAVLDSDAFHAFVETGDIFDQATAARFRDEILSKGNTADAAVLYQNFRGRQADPKFFLEKKGLN